ncbi:MmgE/PrpD family protein [Kitasatospora sp. NPDC056531]|uniref:MmgE/PrpD family protein n=1 Tax=Kitasatospora sp. NPDC056531 TaxID=3345856 RepID=UPI0036B21A87
MDWRALPRLAAEAYPESMPPSSHVEECKFALLDTVASAWSTPDSVPPRSKSSGGNGGFPTSWATGSPAELSSACYENAFAAHASEFDCIHYMAVGHPGAAILPALVPLMQNGEIQAPDVISGYLTGLEVMATLGEAVGDRLRKRGFHSTPVLGAPAAAAAVARALRLDATRTSWAMFLASTSNVGFACAHGTVGKPRQVAAACRGGLEAALHSAAMLGEELPTGWQQPLEVLLQEELPTPLHAFGAPWALDVLPTYHKRFPMCGYFDAPIAHVDALRVRGFLREAVRITLGVPEYIATASKYRLPSTIEQARFSLPFSVAGLLARGSIDPTLFSEPSLSDSDIQRWATAVQVQKVDGELGPLGDSITGFVSVERFDGSHETAAVTYRVEPPVTSWEMLEEKLGNILPNASEATVREIVNGFQEFENLDSRQLAAILALGAENR